MRRLLIRPIARTLGFLLAAALGPALAAPDGFDIVGLRLGMTVEDARAAMLKHAPSMQVTDKTLHYTVHDGVKQHPTPTFLAEIVGVRSERLAQTERITLYFSSPPQPQRLIGVHRLAELPNPATHEQLMDTVIGKYGPPDDSRTTGRPRFPQSFLTWAEKGHPQCSRPSTKLKAGIDVPVLVLDALQKYAHAQRQGIAPADLSQCGAALRFEASGEPVRQFVTRMTDTGNWLSTLQATAAWVSGLEADAKKARMAKGDSPKL